METALEILAALTKALPPRIGGNHAFMLTQDADEGLTIQLALDDFHAFNLDAADLKKTSTEIVEEILEMCRKEKLL